jgi:DNA-binding NarL/FixJ family response regulator
MLRLLARGNIYPIHANDRIEMRRSSAIVRILVVDDFEPFRRFLCEALKARLRLQVVGGALDGLEASQKAKDLQPDLVLLDIGLPKLNGIEAAKTLSRIVPDAKILFVSQCNDADVIAAAMSDGAKGYIWKQTAQSETWLK